MAKQEADARADEVLMGAKPLQLEEEKVVSRVRPSCQKSYLLEAQLLCIASEVCVPVCQLLRAPPIYRRSFRSAADMEFRAA